MAPERSESNEVLSLPSSQNSCHVVTTFLTSGGDENTQESADTSQNENHDRPPSKMNRVFSLK